MANWSDLKAAVAEVIKTNGNNEITGQILQDTLNSIISNVGANATLVGEATPTTNPGAPDGNVFYFATQAGTYTNFGSVVLKEGLNILLWNGTSWAVTNVMNIVQELGTSENAVMSQKAVTNIIGLDEYPTFSESTAYSAGDVVNYNGKLYKFTADHAAGAWTGTDVEPYNLKKDIEERYGTYTDNPEFIRVYTDAEGKFLWGIRVDGSIEWAKGVPTPVQNALKELADKIKDLGGDKIEEVETALNEEIEALQDAIDVINASLKTLTDTFSYQDNPEFVNVVTDAEGKVLLGIKTDGSPYYPNNEMYHVIQNDEYLAAWVDASNKVLFGIKTDGSIYIAKSEYIDAVKEIQEKIASLSDSVQPLTETFSIVSNEEWLHAIVDVEGKLLFGIKAENGEVVMPKQDTYKVVSNDEWFAAWVDSQDKILFGVKADGTFWAAKSNFAGGGNYDEQIAEINETLQQVQDQIKDIDTSGVANTVFTVIDDVEERLAVTTDKDEKVISFRDKEGVLHENKGVDTPQYYLNGKERNFVDKTEVAGEVTRAAENGAVNFEDLNGVSNHNTPNLLIASGMQKTFNDGTNSFTPPNAGYEMSNPIECQAGDWFTRTGTATGMVVVTDANDKNGTRLFNSNGSTLGNTFQVPTDMTWVRYIRMAALKTGAEDGSVVICKGKEAYLDNDRGDYLTVDKLRVQSYNLPKDVKYLKSPDGKYWELYVDDSHQLQIREIDPDIITELPADFPVYTVSGDFSEYFDTWVSMVNTYLAERNKNGVIKYNKLSANPALYAEFRKEKNLSGETRYVVGYPNSYTGPNGEQYLTIYDENFNIIDTGIHVAGTTFDAHDFVFFDDNHVAIFFSNSKSQVQVPIDQNKSGYVTINAVSASIAELKKTNGVWNEIGRFNMYDYPELLTDEFGIYSETGVLEVHPNTLFLDYDGNYVLNIRNNDSFIKIKREENSDGTVTIGSDTLDYNEAIIGRVGGKYNSGYIDPKRVLEEGFSFTDVPTSLHTRSTDEEPAWKFYHEHDIAYWGMKNIGGQNYPTYTLFDNNMWTDNSQTVNYIDVNPRNNYSNNPNGGNESAFLENKSDAGGAYDTHMVSRVVQLSIDWENHLIKDYRVYIIPKQYSYTRSGAQMFDEGVLFISWADQRICGLYDFNDEQTEVENHVYKNGKELFKATVNATGFYRVHGYKSNQ